jgi:uncharacterized RmlC-like cupin family protein
MATHIKKEGIKHNTTYEPGLRLAEGICSATVENMDPLFTLTHNIMPPGHRTRAHYHTNCARGTYIAKGRIRFFFGPEHDQQVIDTEEGDYIYTAKGEIHAQLNLSDTEPAEFTSTYVGVSDRELSGKVFVEPPRK